MHDTGPQLDRRFAWRGRQIAWTSIGSGPPVVMCHGTPWSSWLWAPYARALAAEFTVHLWDMPGYGASSKAPEHDVDLGIQGQAFAALLEHWDLEAPHVIAHDYGGAVSLRAHLLHGRRFASLCLVDVVALRPWGSPFFTLVAEHADTFGRLPAPVHLGALEAYVAGASHRGLSPAQSAALLAPWRDPVGQAAFYRQIAQADERFTAEIEPHLGEIDVPTHIVWGEQDTWIPPDRAARLAAAVAGSTVTLVPDAGHLIQLDAPVALATELHRWLVRVTSGAP
ncbi:alpha/beta hydrolase [Isoptericola sp. S6320L]|uniref:alpha/beta fold hydrolase n=1 Tax=Isoptericola sp. S6320L TaxID=2926411 RepID=UPI001FF3F7F8|nr:alpha/beta hydrolase [Isoptericola sp. S6320L]MCK0115443.1 alpha/beta hydrolase [Isoptericola sp. S6320L]